MQAQNLDYLLQDAAQNFTDKPFVTQKKMLDLALKNDSDLAEKNLPDKMRTPTADELTEMRQYAIDYKHNNRRASKREVRKATQQHFNIRIFR